MDSATAAPTDAELLLRRIAVIKAEIKEAQQEEKALMAELDEAFTDGRLKRLERDGRWVSGPMTLTRQSRTSYVHSPGIKELEIELKAQKNKEIQAGKAEAKVTHFWKAVIDR